MDTARIPSKDGRRLALGDAIAGTMGAVTAIWSYLSRLSVHLNPVGVRSQDNRGSTHSTLSAVVFTSRQCCGTKCCGTPFPPIKLLSFSKLLRGHLFSHGFQHSGRSAARGEAGVRGEVGQSNAQQFLRKSGFVTVYQSAKPFLRQKLVHGVNSLSSAQR